MNSMSVVLIRCRDDLQHYRQELTELAENALDENLFYEPWMLFPALEVFTSASNLFLVLVYTATSTNGTNQRVLCGFFPLEKRWLYHGLPLPYFTLWRHPYCFLSTPLVHKLYAFAAYRTFFKWAKNEQRYAQVMELPQLSADGPASDMLHSVIRHDAGIKFAESLYTRAILYPRGDAEIYLANSLSGKSRKELRRKKKRLSELGHVEFTELDDSDDLEIWMHDFMQLEAAGWKGRNGTAFKSKSVDKEYFLVVIREAFKRGKLMMLALRLDGRPLAMKCNLLSFDGGYAFKIAFDENFRHFSPGVLLELEHIRRVHRNVCIRWMDSCAKPDNFMINHLWSGRKPMRTVVVSTSRVLGDSIIKLLPILKRFRTWCLSNY